jgi:hypothetical protein
MLLTHVGSELRFGSEGISIETGGGTIKFLERTELGELDLLCGIFWLLCPLMTAGSLASNFTSR